MSNSVVNNSLIAKRYAKALFGSERKHDKIFSDLKLLYTICEDLPKASAIIKNKFIPKNKQINFFSGIKKKHKFQPQVSELLDLLVENRRLYLLPEIVALYASMIRLENNEVEAEIISAKTLTKKQLEMIKKTLADKYKTNIVIEEKVDERILGGVTIRLGSNMIDCSLASKLRQYGNLSKKTLSTI